MVIEGTLIRGMRDLRCCRRDWEVGAFESKNRLAFKQRSNRPALLELQGKTSDQQGHAQGLCTEGFDYHVCNREKEFLL